MCTNTKLALCVAAVLGSASAAQTAPQHSTVHQTGSTIQYQLPRSASGDDRFAPAPGQSTRANAVYFDPSPGTIQRIHLLRLGAADSLDLETGSAGRVQISRVRRNT